MICEQVFRMLLDKEYSRASRLLDIHSDLFPSSMDIELSVADKTFVRQAEEKSLPVGREESE